MRTTEEINAELEKMKSEFKGLAEAERIADRKYEIRLCVKMAVWAVFIIGLAFIVQIIDGL